MKELACKTGQQEKAFPGTEISCRLCGSASTQFSQLAMSNLGKQPAVDTDEDVDDLDGQLSSIDSRL